MPATKSDIITLPNKHLRTRSKRIGLIDDTVHKLIEDMKHATLDWEDSREHEIGVALAAIQIDQAYRVVVVRNDFENKADRTFSVFINPKITKYEGDIIEDYEGCLSVKNIYGKVPRHDKVRITAEDENGNTIRLTAEGFLARIFQHEIDHTNGTLFIDHIKQDKSCFYRLDKDGQLIQLDYDKEIANSTILW